MILVTVGLHYQPFDRLIRAIDDLARALDEKVVIQRGASHYVPQHAESFEYASNEVMKNLTQEARLVVTHAGAGSILTAFQLGIPVIVVPRRKMYAEHLDDNQLEFAEL